MVSFRESKTATNLLIAYSAEAQARTRYDIFSQHAKDEGYMQIAAIFDKTAKQEYEHALRFFKFFNGGEYETAWPFPAGVIKDTHTNLIASAELELHVHSVMYKGFAEVAAEEGFQRAADTLDAISVSEVHHEQMFRELADNIATEKLYRRKDEKVWQCLSCGYLHQGEEAPSKCPACVKPQGYFQLHVKNW